MTAKPRGHNNANDPSGPSRPRSGGSGGDVSSNETTASTAAHDGRAGNAARSPSTPPPSSGDSVTRPTGVSGGAPEGKAKEVDPGDDYATQRSLEMENSGATVLASSGYRVRQSPTAAEIAQARAATGDVGDPSKDPDYLLEGHVFDCYSPTKPDKDVRGIWTEAKNKVFKGQTQRVVVNLEDWRGDLGALRQQFDDWSIPGLKELKVITPQGEIIQFDLPRPSDRE